MTESGYIPPLIKVVIFCPPTQICITSGGEEERGTKIPGFIEEDW